MLMLNVQRLRVLREVLSQGSFSEAASALNYTQSAVSQAIATLESEAGVPLIERDRRGVRPTSAGERLAEHAGRILTQLDVAEAELGAIAGIRGGELRMASFPTAGATLMPLAIAAFRSAYPHVALSLVEGEPEELIPRLRDGEFDLGLIFGFGGAGEPGPGLQSSPLFEDPMRLALPKGHRLTRKELITLEDLSDEAWVQTSEAQCLRAPRGARLSRRGIRAARLLRERRLPDRAGPGRGRRRGRADPAAGALADASATTSRSASSNPMARSGTSSCRRREPGSRCPRLRRCWRSCATRLASTGSSRPRDADPRRVARRRTPPPPLGGDGVQMLGLRRRAD